MSTTKLTPHQTEVLERLVRSSTRSGFVKPVDESHVGSKGALAHLMHKRYIEIHHVLRGPRGGSTRFFIPTEVGLTWHRRRKQSGGVI